MSVRETAAVYMWVCEDIHITQWQALFCRELWCHCSLYFCPLLSKAGGGPDRRVVFVLSTRSSFSCTNEWKNGRHQKTGFLRNTLDEIWKALADRRQRLVPWFTLLSDLQGIQRPITSFGNHILIISSSNPWSVATKIPLLWIGVKVKPYPITLFLWTSLKLLHRPAVASPS